MTNPRRDFLKELFAASAFSGLIGSSRSASGISGALSALLDPERMQEINPEFDRRTYDFWSGFLASDAEPIIKGPGKSRGASSPDQDAQPVFLHYDKDNGFRNAAELDSAKLVDSEDVLVSVNTSTVKVGAGDQKTFERLQNAQIRVDVAQKKGIIQLIEAMSYTVVGGMRSVQIAKENNTRTATGALPPKKATPTVQNISISSDAAWQKMQNIPLPGGEGRWALNLEAQKKDSLFCKILQDVVKQGGLFAPMLGLPGITMSALQSFNLLYGAIHAQPVQVIQSNPLRVFATKGAYQSTGSPGAVTGIQLQSGTYILTPSAQSPTPDQLKGLAVMQGRVVPVNTSLKAKPQDLDEAAADTLKDVTYVTFDVEVSPTTLFSNGGASKSG